MGHGFNTALKAALFATGKKQERIAALARIPPQKLSHAIYYRRELDDKERERLVKVLARFGVVRSVSELFAETVPA